MAKLTCSVFVCKYKIIADGVKYLIILIDDESIRNVKLDE